MLRCRSLEAEEALELPRRALRGSEHLHLRCSGFHRGAGFISERALIAFVFRRYKIFLPAPRWNRNCFVFRGVVCTPKSIHSEETAALLRRAVFAHPVWNNGGITNNGMLQTARLTLP